MQLFSCRKLFRLLFFWPCISIDRIVGLSSASLFFYITFPPALMRNEPWPIIRGIIIIIPRRCVIFFIGKFFCIWWVALFFFPSPRLPNPLPVVQDKSIFYFIKEIKQSKQAREISQEASLILTGRMIVNTYCWLFEEMAVSLFL